MPPNKYARARDPRIQRLLDIVRLPGRPGARWCAAEAAMAVGVRPETIVDWIEKGWLRASKMRRPNGGGWYRIRRRALRRAIADYPQVARAVLKANPG